MTDITLFGGRKLSFASDKPLVMGILNMTSDSFYAPSRIKSASDAASKAAVMAREGADIIDIGAESTRPGSMPAGEDDEIAALTPVVEAVRRALPEMPISIDTRNPRAARMTLKAGADIVNDVSGLEPEGMAGEMVSLLRESGAAYVLTHTQGTPDVMQNDPRYDDFFAELLEFFERKLKILSLAGVSRERVIIDPGVGFGKAQRDNLEILANIGELGRFGLPVLIGASRKSFIGRVMDEAGFSEIGASPEERLGGTLAVSAICAADGASIIRVHDVKENRQAIEIANAVRIFRHDSGV
ncbi:dihydropteroate synthase [Synergistales bacterium]|nr:dihydropteroate synthase [Synergistales bacterium]